MMILKFMHTNSIIWHIGESIPIVHPDSIVYVSADGDELNFVRSEFTNLRDRPAAGKITFFGYDAKTIVANLEG